jgi:hypothetical protein
VPVGPRGGLGAPGLVLRSCHGLGPEAAQPDRVVRRGAGRRNVWARSAGAYQLPWKADRQDGCDRMNGYGDQQPPGIRADAVPASLQSPSGFAMLFLTFVAWDVLKLWWSVAGGAPGYAEIDSGTMSTDYFFRSSPSGGNYTFTAQGCSRALDGSTNYCSPSSGPYHASCAPNTGSLREFLQLSSIDSYSEVNIRSLLGSGDIEISLRTVMDLQ